MTYATDGKCHNAQPGTYGHECGKPAVWVGTEPSGFQSGFCDACKLSGYEARQCSTWESYKESAKDEPLEWAALWAAMDASPQEWIPTTESMFWELLEVVPPRCQVQGAYLVGEPLRHVDGHAVHACFKQTKDGFFARNLTVEQFKGAV
jgi:hypothetical protein